VAEMPRLRKAPTKVVVCQWLKGAELRQR